VRPNDVQARLEDMTALGTAASPDELHRALVLRPRRSNGSTPFL
jgi:hypothetical protein